MCPNQFGFRPSRSTSHAIHIARRLQDISEQQGSNMILTFLDWEKAFDKVQHDRLDCFEQIRSPYSVCDVLKDCYNKASFSVEDEYGQPNLKKKQFAGIRQGCPLSPFLFVLLMRVVEMLSLGRLPARAHSSTILVQRLYYADETILIAASTATANRLVAEVENISAQYCWLLNRNGCCFTFMNGNNVSKFSDGPKLRRVEETTHLGHHITEGMDVKHENFSTKCSRPSDSGLNWRNFGPQ